MTTKKKGLFAIIVRLLRKIRDQQARIRELEQLLQDAKADAYVDPLTGLHNRRFFDEQMAHQIALCGKSLEKFSIAVCDIDDFKLLNTLYTHDGGDSVLEGFATLLRGVCRKQDWPARVGGEEFAFILPDADRDGALIFLNRVRDAVANHQFSVTSDGVARITISTGVAEYQIGDTPKTMYKRATLALKSAKANGKNVVLAA